MIRILIIFFMSTLTIACGGKKEREPESSPGSRAFVLERENFFNSLKNPDDLATSLTPGVIEFDSILLNDPNHLKYSDNKVTAAANLGIYLADLNYCVLFKKAEQIKKYFQSSYELSKAIQIDKNLLEFLRQRYQKNIDQNDSVKAVINQLFDHSTAGLQGTERERLAGIAMAGYQIENLYLVLSALESLPATLSDDQIQLKRKLDEYIIDQQGKFEVVYNFIRVNSDPLDPANNPNYPFFDHGLRELIDAYRNVSSSDSAQELLREKVAALRSKIINL